MPNWEKKWQNVIAELNLEIGMCSSEIVYCYERIDRNRRDYFLFGEESMPTTWMEAEALRGSQLNDKKDLRREAVLGLGDYKDDNDDDKVVAIPSHQVREIGTHSEFHWETEINHQDGKIEIHSEFRGQIRIETDLGHREISLAKMKLIGASTKLITTPVMKVQEGLDEERALFRRATVRASSNCDDAQQAAEERARFMSESNEELCSILNQTQIIRDFVDHDRQMHGISEERKVKVSREDTDSDCAECVLTRKSTIAVGSWMQNTRRLSGTESEFYAKVICALILLGAKCMMMIMMAMLASVFGTESSSAKSAMGRHLEMPNWNGMMRRTPVGIMCRSVTA